MSLQDETEHHLGELERLLDEAQEDFFRRYERVTVTSVGPPKSQRQTLSQAQLKNIFLVSMAVGGGILAALGYNGAFEKPKPSHESNKLIEEIKSRDEYWRKRKAEQEARERANSEQGSGVDN